MIKTDFHGLWKACVHLLNWTPSTCRYSPGKDFEFGLSLNLLFGLAATIIAANMYYSYPVLNKLAASFDVPYERVSLVPTLLQAGYGTGILLICPLGDRWRLRPLILALIGVTFLIWIVLCLTHDFQLFCALSFLTGLTTITPQLMIPLASGLAAPPRRATAISIVFSRLMLGMLLPRVLSGVVTEFTSWRTVYWIALGLQGIILLLLWLFMPDYPADGSEDLGYFRMLAGIITLVFRQPILVYACAIVFFSNGAFASYWTTLTALLSSAPYNFSSLQIGLFALIGVAPMLLVPVYSRLVIDRFVPTFCVVLGLLCAILGVIIGTLTASLTIAGIVLQALTLDFGVQTASIAYRAAIYATVPSARNRVNVAYTVSAFAGQLAGTSIGNQLYATGDWVYSGGFNIALLGAGLILALLRGPWEKRWYGWRGGFGIRKQLQNGMNTIEP